MAEATKGGTGLERAVAPAGATASSMDRVLAAGAEARGRWTEMPATQQRWIGASALLIGAVIAGMLWYTGRTDWRLLYSGLESKDMQQIAQELTAAGIPYTVTEDGGGIQVGSDQMDRARMEVAAKGMPQSGRMGFELFDKPNWVGSEFDEKVNYQRAMEGELERTIGTLGVVKTARVHLALAKDSMFSAQKEAAKASVVLKLRRTAMPPEQAEGIRNLVAGAVEGLTPENVTLVDADGRANLTAVAKDPSSGDAEKELEAKLVAMLEPTAGQDNIRATVTVSYDQSSQEKTDEVYDPAQTATLTMQKSEQTMTPAARAAGVPGTASNTPAAAAAGSVAAAPGAVAAGGAAGAAAPAAAAGVPPLLQTGTATASAAATGPVQKDASLPVYPWQGGGASQTTSEENGTYGVTRHLLHQEQGPGRVRRLTAAVVVNDRMSTEGAGKLEHTVWKPRSAEEMKRLEQLARAAVGFDAGRGDDLVIENVSFSSNQPGTKPAAIEKLLDESETVLHGQPGLLRTLSLAGLSLLLVLLVVRPLTKQMMASMAPETPEVAELPAPVKTPWVKPEPPKRIPPPHTVQMQQMVEHVGEHIRTEPMQSSRMLQSWISESPDERY